MSKSSKFSKKELDELFDDGEKPIKENRVK